MNDQKTFFNSKDSKDKHGRTMFWKIACFIFQTLLCVSWYESVNMVYFYVEIPFVEVQVQFYQFFLGQKIVIKAIGLKFCSLTLVVESSWCEIVIGWHLLPLEGLVIIYYNIL